MNGLIETSLLGAAWWLVPLLQSYWFLAAAAAGAATLPFHHVAGFRAAVLISSARGKLWSTSVKQEPGQSRRNFARLFAAIWRWSVPQSYFAHFYVLATIWTALLLIAASFPFLSSFPPGNHQKLPGGLHQRLSAGLIIAVPDGSVCDVLGFERVLLLGMLEIHSVRRLYEATIKARYSPGSCMHILGYLYGLSYYTALPLSFLLHGVPASPDQAQSLSWSGAAASGSPPHGALSGAQLLHDVPGSGREGQRSSKEATQDVGATGSADLEHENDLLVRAGRQLFEDTWLKPIGHAGTGQRQKSRARQSLVAVLGCVRWWHVIGAAVYVWGSWHQWRCHSILAALRAPRRAGEAAGGGQYRVPHGDWFALVSCAHYLAEIVLYCGWLVATGGRSLMMWLILLWVVVNLTLTAIETHKWYKLKFDAYPAQRRAIFPCVL